MEKINHKRSRLYLLYPVVDFFVASFFSVLAVLATSFSSIVNHAVTGEQYLATTIYILVSSLLMVGIMAATKVYKILTRNFGLFESIKIAYIALGVKLVGLVVLRLPDIMTFLHITSWNSPFISTTFFSWALSTIGTIFALPSCRLVFRIKNVLHSSVSKKNVVKTMVIGAGASAKIAIDETRNNYNNSNKIVVIADDDINKIGFYYTNIPVEGPISNVKEIIAKYNVEEVIIAISNLTKDRLHEIFTLLMQCNVRVKRMPLLSEMSGPNDIRITEVDLDELLSRPSIKLDNSKIFEVLNGETVMVTGAGGSIGSELVRQIFRAHPKTLVLFDIYENSTYDIQQQLNIIMRKEGINDINVVTLIGSTYNETKVEQIIKKYRPSYIYHAAAYKHVPLMEDSPAEAIRTNVVGTYNVAKMADKYGVKKMVLVSTDKAVRPTNVMGATKRFAETIIQYFAEKSTCTAYAAVRFGNVLGSNGSVVPLFKKQLEAGGPITITDKNIIRYFMTIPEAVSLILQCGLFATGGEIFILDMGEPVKIIDLAEKMIRQSGKVPYKDIEIIETGLRPGEKLYEELLLDKEHQTKTENDKIFIEEKESIYPIEEEIISISKAFELEENEDVKDLLASIITTYSRKK